MRLRRELAISLAVQGGGAASVLLATLWLGAAHGPEVQGGFNRAKSTLEFVGAFASFGLPQALFFFARTRGLARARALRWVLGAAALGLPLGAAAWFAIDRPPAVLPTLAFAVAVGAFVGHGILRALLLLRTRATRFNLVTALPQVATLAGVGVCIAALAAARGATPPVSAGIWFAVFAGAYALAAVFAWRSLPRTFDGGTPGPVTPDPAPGGASGRTGPVALLRYGLAAWATAVLATAAILATQHAVEAGAGRDALGRFTMAMTLTQVPLTPIAYAAPLLLRRWTGRPGGRAARRWSAALFGALSLVAGAVALVAVWRDDLWLGPAYAGATAALAILLVGGAADAAARVLAVQAQAAGRPGAALRAEAARLAVLVAAWAVWPGSGPGLLGFCAAWAAAAVVAAGVLVGAVGRAPR